MNLIIPLAVVLLSPSVVSSSLLLKHVLSVNREFPLLGVFQGTIRCSEHSDPRIKPLCRYIELKYKSTDVTQPELEVKQEMLKACIDTCTFPITMYELSDVCAEGVYEGEDEIFKSFKEHEYKSLPEQLEYLEGIVTLAKDLRPLSWPVRTLVFICMVGSVALIGLFIYKFIFKQDIYQTVE